VYGILFLKNGIAQYIGRLGGPGPVYNRCIQCRFKILGDKMCCSRYRAYQSSHYSIGAVNVICQSNPINRENPHIPTQVRAFRSHATPVSMAGVATRHHDRFPHVPSFFTVAGVHS
jgi:hypothetical protein